MSNKKKFNLFDWYFRGEKESDKLDINVLEKPNFTNFFKLLWKKLGKLLSANLLFIFCNFPIFFLIIASSQIFSIETSSPLYYVWGPINGAMKFDTNPLLSYLAGIFGVFKETYVINLATKIFYILGFFVIFTLGISKVGTSYLYRNMMSGEAIFPFSDFVYVVKKNFKQALIIGIIDAAFIAMFIFNINFLIQNYSTSNMNGFMLFFTVAMLVVYFFARNYAYIMIFTFDLKLKHIIKNSLFFTILGLKRNLCALLGVIAVVLLNLVIFFIFMPLGAILPFIITLAICDFIGVYTAFPVIIRYMLSEEDKNHLIYKISYEEDNIEAETYEEDNIEAET